MNTKKLKTTYNIFEKEVELDLFTLSKNKSEEEVVQTVSYTGSDYVFGF